MVHVVHVIMYVCESWEIEKNRSKNDTIHALNYYTQIENVIRLIRRW